MPFLRALDVYHDLAPRSAATNMAVDEALLEFAARPSIRFYRWNHAALSFGYFDRYREVEEYARDHDLVRRWTGGGMVFHGTDLTYGLILPRRTGQPQLAPREVYQQVHEALRLALSPHCHAQLAAFDAPKVSAACFGNSVVADVLVGERKIAGAAQRRTRAGLLQQGSIQSHELPCDFAESFAAALCPDFELRSLGQGLLQSAQMLAAEKYGTQAWLRQR